MGVRNVDKMCRHECIAGMWRRPFRARWHFHRVDAQHGRTRAAACTRSEPRDGRAHGRYSDRRHDAYRSFAARSSGLHFRSAGQYRAGRDGRGDCREAREIPAHARASADAASRAALARRSAAALSSPRAPTPSVRNRICTASPLAAWRANVPPGAENFVVRMRNDSENGFAHV